MLVRLLKERGLLPGIVTWIIIAGLMILKVFLEVEPYAFTDLLTTHWILGRLQGQPILMLSIGVVLIAFIGILARFFYVKLGLGSKYGKLETLLLMTIILAQSEVLFRTEVLLSVAITISLFLVLISTHKEASVLPRLFHVGVLLGLSTLSSGPTFVLLLAVYFGVFVLRKESWRDWFVPILGILMVAAWLMLLIVWEESPILEFHRIVSSAWLQSPNISTLEFGNIIILGGILLSTTKLFSCLTTGTVVERNYTLVLVGWIVVLMLMVVVFSYEWRMALALAAFPLSVYIGRLINDIQRWWIADLLVLTMLMAPVLNILLRA
ncbi:hypothetical protein ACFLR1_00735 [Bacteroidota bacterium]